MFGSEQKAAEHKFSGGPFHYQIRASTYGELYDEIPWRVLYKIDQYRERDGIDRNALHNTYNIKVLNNNWFEESRDRDVIRCCDPSTSQFDHFYQTTYSKGYTKRYCNKEKPHIRSLNLIPNGICPGHQPELDIDILRCVPKPSSFVCEEAMLKQKKEEAKANRYCKYYPPPEPNTFFHFEDLEKLPL